MTSAYPLEWPENWPRTPAGRRCNHSQFRTTFTRARDGLLNELRLLGAKGVVVSSWMPLRLDGLPRADAARMRIDDPGVAVYFNLRDRPMVMARDKYWCVHDNLRSIGLAIENLRGLERHGGAYMMERAFAGFAALPPPSGPVAAPRRSWRMVMGFTEDPSIDLSLVEERYRYLANKAHPDAGGSEEAMSELNAARDAARKELAS